MQRQLILIATVAALTAVAVFTPRLTNLAALARSVAQADSDTLVKNGDKLRAAHQYQAAVDAYQKALAANPKLETAYVGMGIAYLGMHYYDNAETALKMGLEIAPNDVIGLRYLAETYDHMERKADAASLLKKALALAPERYDLHWLMARALANAEESNVEYGKAELLAQIALKERPNDVGIYHVLSFVTEEQGKYDDTVTFGKKWIELDPGDAAAHEELAWGYQGLKKYGEAVSEFQAAVKLDPNYMWHHQELAAAYRGAGRKLESDGELRETVRTAPLLIKHAPKVVSNYVFVARAYDLLNQQEDAITWYKKAIELSPSDYLPHKMLADKYAETNRCADAVPEYQAASRIKPQTLDAWIGLVNCYFQLKQWADLTRAGEQALKLKSDYPWVHNEIGIAYDNLQRYPEAIAQFKEAIRLAPNDPTLHSNLAFCEMRAGDRDAATAEYNILKGLDEAKAAIVLNALNPPQTSSSPTAPSEPAPTYEYFRVKVLKKEDSATYIGGGHYVYVAVEDLNTGNALCFRYYVARPGNSGFMDVGTIYNVRRGRRGNDENTFVELEMDGKWYSAPEACGY